MLCTQHPDERSSSELLWLVHQQGSYEDARELRTTVQRPAQVDEARQVRQRAVDLNEEGNAHLLANDFEQALRCYRQLVMQYPGLPHGHFNVGNALVARADVVAEAAAAPLHSTRLSPHSVLQGGCAAPVLDGA